MNKYLKIQLEHILSEITPNVFLEDAQDDSVYPYLVYSLTQAMHNENQIIYTLDVDVWDKSTTTVNVDDISSKLKKLDKTSYIDENVQFSLHFDRILNTKSESEQWQRYTVVFELRVIERR